MAKKILLIEDEKILADMYKAKFIQAGFKVIAAFDAEEGLRLVKREKPDLVVLDILLPKESGIFFLEQLRKNPEVASIPVVAFSNLDDPEKKERARKLGVIDYWIKTSYTPQEIVEKLKSFFKQYGYGP